MIDFEFGFGIKFSDENGESLELNDKIDTRAEESSFRKTSYSGILLVLSLLFLFNWKPQIVSNRGLVNQKNFSGEFQCFRKIACFLHCSNSNLLDSIKVYKLLFCIFVKKNKR